MEKRHVFVVTGRQLVDGVPRGAIETLVVCADGDRAVRRILAQQRPTLWVTTVTGLASLEDRVKKIRNTLLRTQADWDVLVDPALVEESR